ncbi:MAG: hypothetical protein LPK85_10805, partial [Gammaproteobacteria bacterium]|nr:hypothetical protein [Gammaproteobacteria bacterium]
MKAIPSRLKGLLQGSVMRRNLTLTFGRQLAAAAAQLLLVVVIARELGPEGNGLYALAILLPNMLSTFLNLGVGPATVYYLGRGDVDGRQAATENLRLALWVSFFGVTFAIPLLIIWSESILPG